MKEKKSFKLLRDVVQDILSGLTGSDLAKKYQMSGEDLRAIIKTISVIKNTTAADLYGRSGSEQDAEALNIIRMLPRTQVFVKLPIGERDHDVPEGNVCDISESGLRVRGIDTKVDDTKRFVVRADEAFEMEPFLFDAKCRWVKKEGPEGESYGGFEITYISPNDMEKLRKLISTIVGRLDEISRAAADLE